TTAWFDALEKIHPFLQGGWDVAMSLGPVDAVRWVEARERVLIGNVPSELCEEALEDLGHPIPARSHVERESLCEVLARSSARGAMPVHHGHFPAVLGHECGG